MVRVRFAPSPTGHLHVGAVRTCLFNWLFARNQKGKFLLRIEDTDAARSSKEMTRIIFEGLRWLGIDWDEEPIFQSERLPLYREKAEQLVREKKAYWCYCRPDEIQNRKKGQEQSWKYDGYCRSLTDGTRDRYEAEGRSKAIRFSIPQGETFFKDLIHGPISVKHDVLDDFVLLRSDGLPTYHLSVVVDDAAQGITHVIRGDDHISNTPKHILLYEALGLAHPEFAHLALILGPDRKKLSKRHGVTSVLSFKEKGYFPLSLINFLAQMSWDPGEGERIYALQELFENIKLEKLSKNSPVFDLGKLEWFNGQIISQMSARSLSEYVEPSLKGSGLWREELKNEERDWFYALLILLKERSRTVDDFVSRGRPFLSDDFEVEPEAVDKHLRDERLPELMAALSQKFGEMEEFSAEAAEQVLRDFAGSRNVKAAVLIHACRVLTLGTAVSPSLFDVLELLGRDRVVKRLGRIEEILEKRNGGGIHD